MENSVKGIPKKKVSIRHLGLTQELALLQYHGVPGICSIWYSGKLKVHICTSPVVQSSAEPLFTDAFTLSWVNRQLSKEVKNYPEDA